MAESDGRPVARLIRSASQAAPPVNATIFNAAIDIVKPVVKPVYTGLTLALDYVYIPAFRFALHLYRTLPLDIISALTGLALTFGGGAYTASIAAIEAFRMTGWETTRACLLDVFDECQAVYEANAADDRAKAGQGDNDAKELVTRKLSVWMTAIKDPEKLSRALGGLYGSWLAVQGVLRLEFARTITLGVSLAELATPALERITVPFLVHTIPKPFHHWIPLIVKSAARTIGVAVAWRVQTIVSAVHLALRGGLLFSRSLMRWANRRKLLSVSEEDTYLDEALGYSVAVAGFWFQLNAGFDLPFPLNIVMLPFSAVEWYIRYTVTTSDVVPAA